MESLLTKHRKRQQDIKTGKCSKEKKISNDKKFKLKQRSNSLFDHEGVNKEGRKFYRRKPPQEGGKHFKPPPDKPGDGGKIKNHPEGKMLKASKIADQQTAGKSLRPYLNGVGYQLRLHVAVRKLVALSLPDVKKTVRYKAKDGKPSRPIFDPRLMHAQLSLRRDKRALDAFDQWDNKEVGAFPVQEDQSKISYICLGDSSEEETENRKLHPKNWMGKDLENNKVDTAKSLVSLLTFMMPSSQLGNMKGDAELFDEDGLLKIPKEEVLSEPETTARDGESESADEIDDEMDDPEIEGTMNTKEKEAQTGDLTDKERDESERETEEATEEAETKEPEEAETMEPDSDSDIEIIEEVIRKPQIVELDDMETDERMGGVKSEPGLNPGNPIPSSSTGNTKDPTLEEIQTKFRQLSKLLYQHVSKANPKTEVTTPERTKVKKEEPKEEPEDPTPENEPVSDTDECIQNLQDHIESTQTVTEPPSPQVPEATEQTHGPQQDHDNQHQETKNTEHESDTGSQGIEDIESSESSQDEVTVDPRTLDTPEEAKENTIQPSKKKKKKLERNNNREKRTSPPNSRNRGSTSNRKNRKLLVHKVPVSFPVAGNLMESEESIGYVYNALQSVNAPRDLQLPADAVVNATLLNSLENNQERATVIVELDSENRCAQVLKNARKKRDQDKDFEYYITPTPQRVNSRYVSNSDEEINTGNSPEYKKAKKSDKTHKYKSSSKESPPKTPKKLGKDPKNDGQGSRSETDRPTNAVSTPLPGTSKINPNASIDYLAELARGLKDVAPVPHVPQPQQKILDTSRMDMGMRVEVENDYYVGGNLFDNTTTLIPTEDADLVNVRQECIAKEFDLAFEVESYRRRTEAWSNDLRQKLERRGRPGPGPGNQEPKETRRRTMGPSDLKYSKLKVGRGKDLRDFIKTKRRTNSASPVARTPSGANSNYPRTEERREAIERLRSSMPGLKEKMEGKNDSSDSSEINEEGEVAPSEDELMNVRYSESDTPTRATDPDPEGDPDSAPKSKAKKKSHRFLTTDEAGNVVNAERNDSPPASEKYRKNQQLLREIKKDQDQVRQQKSEPKKPKRVISPIKGPDKTPNKSTEDTPLSKLASRVLIPPPRLDLRDNLNLRPTSSKPKIDGGIGPVQYRINCNFPPSRNNDSPKIQPWKPWTENHTPISNPWSQAADGHTKWGTSHSNRPFIAGNTTSRDDGMMTGQETGAAPGDGEGEEEDEPKSPEGDDPKRKN